MALDRLDDDERAKFNLRRQGKANVVNEAGHLAMVKSTKHRAKPDVTKFACHPPYESQEKDRHSSTSDSANVS